MKVVRWNPFEEINLLQSQMNRLFQSAMNGWSADIEGTSRWVPPADIYETDNELIVRADLPGVHPKDLDVRVENNVLTIRGERQMDQKVSDENVHRVERSYGTFSRSFTLSTSVDTDKIKADYADGVLTVTLPKAEAAKPRRIEIGTSTKAAIAA